MTVSQLKANLSMTVVLAFVVMLFVVCFAPVQTASRDIMLVLIGALTGIVKDIYGFYFGSSAGSERKTEIMTAVQS